MKGRVTIWCAAILIGMFKLSTVAEAGCQIWIRNETQYSMMVSVEDPVAHKPLSNDDVLLGPNNTRPIFLDQTDNCDRVVFLKVAVGPGSLRIKEISARPVSAVGSTHIFAIKMSDLL